MENVFREQHEIEIQKSIEVNLIYIEKEFQIFSCDREHNLATFREIASVKPRFNGDGKNKLRFIIGRLGSRFYSDLGDRPSDQNYENHDRN